MSGKEIVTTEGLKCLLKRQFESLQEDVKEAQVACKDLESQSVYVDDCEIEDAIEVWDTPSRSIHFRIRARCSEAKTTEGRIKTETCEISRVWYRIDKLIDVVEAFERRHDSWCQKLGQAMADRDAELKALQAKVDQIWERTCNRTESWKPGDGQD